jgi:polyphosphate kinase
VRSIVGRFLEHTRAWYFGNGGKPEVFCSSADWMERNFFRRVEAAFPICDPELRARIIEELDFYLADDTNAWSMQRDGSYLRIAPDAASPVSAQELLIERYANPAAMFTP